MRRMHGHARTWMLKRGQFIYTLGILHENSQVYTFSIQYNYWESLMDEMWNFYNFKNKIQIKRRRKTFSLCNNILDEWGFSQVISGDAFVLCHWYTDIAFVCQVASEAAGQGVAITGDNHRNTWDWVNSVIFAATIVTTIGPRLFFLPHQFLCTDKTHPRKVYFYLNIIIIRGETINGWIFDPTIQPDQSVLR